LKEHVFKKANNKLNDLNENCEEEASSPGVKASIKNF